MYATVIGQSILTDELFYKLQNKLHKEIQVQKDMLELLGALELVSLYFLLLPSNP